MPYRRIWNMIGIGSRSSLQESLFRYLAIHLLFFSSNRLITSIAAVTPSFHKGGGGVLLSVLFQLQVILALVASFS